MQLRLCAQLRSPPVVRPWRQPPPPVPVPVVAPVPVGRPRPLPAAKLPARAGAERPVGCSAGAAALAGLRPGAGLRTSCPAHCPLAPANQTLKLETEDQGWRRRPSWAAAHPAPPAPHRPAPPRPAQHPPVPLLPPPLLWTLRALAPRRWPLLPPGGPAGRALPLWPGRRALAAVVSIPLALTLAVPPLPLYRS